MKKIYIVTGANGFLGNNIVRKLVKNNEIDSLKGLNCKIYEGDVTKKETLTDIFNVENDTELYVLHSAAIVYIKSKYNKQVYDVNVGGTKNIIDKVLEHNAK